MDADAAEIEERRRPRPDPGGEPVGRFLQLLLGDVLDELDLEAAGLELVGQQACVGGRLGERRIGIGIVGIADHQRDALHAALVGGRPGLAR